MLQIAIDQYEHDPLEVCFGDFFNHPRQDSQLELVVVLAEIIVHSPGLLFLFNADIKNVEAPS